MPGVAVVNPIVIQDIISGSPIGVPDTHTKISSTGHQTVINKGQLNKLQLRPQIRNEHMEQSSLIQSTITTTNIVGQIFKASQDNINGLELTLKPFGNQTIIDNVEGYVDSAAVQAVWAASGSLALLESTTISPNNASTQSIVLPTDDLGDEWVKTIVAADLTGVTFNLDLLQTEKIDKIQIRFFVGDGVSTKSILISPPNKNIWGNFNFVIGALTEDGVGITDITNITQVGFRVAADDGGEFAYFDNLSYFPFPGSVEIKLWDMGPTIPVSGTTTISSGTQYITLGDFGLSAASITLDLISGKRRYAIHDFVARADTPAVVIDNYYFITIHYVDQDVEVFGSKTAPAIDRYVSGFAFTVPDEITAITTLGTYNDLMFSIFSTGDVYVEKVQITVGAPAGNNTMGTIVIETDSEQIEATVAAELHFHNRGNNIVLDVSNRPLLMSKTSKLEIYYNDDFTDSITNIDYSFFYFYEPQVQNG